MYIMVFAVIPIPNALVHVNSVVTDRDGLFSAGFLIGVPVMRNLKRQPWEDVLWYICLVVYLVLMVAIVLFNCFYPDYPTTDWSKCCDDPIITKEKIDE